MKKHWNCKALCARVCGHAVTKVTELECICECVWERSVKWEVGE